jgi:hypothetical protein
MINDLVLEEIIIKAWRYADVLLFLLTCYHDRIRLRSYSTTPGVPILIEKNIGELFIGRKDLAFSFGVYS